MVSSSRNASSTNTLEDLPDELLLQTLSFLSPVDIFESFLNLNSRINRTITFYRENIFLSHLSRSEFEILITKYLEALAPQVRCLTISDRSATGLSSKFEQKFHRIDQQFPLLKKLFFNQIELETIENLSWRFNSMTNLEDLIIEIADNRISIQRVHFNDFLCGKLFSTSNSFRKLSIHCHEHFFSIPQINVPCTNIHSLSIRIRHLNDLLKLFDFLPNIEDLSVKISSLDSYNKGAISYRFDQLWWKVPILTKFELTIEANELTNHENVLPSDILFQLIKSLYELKELRVNIDLNFSQSLRESTTTETFDEFYLPFANGSFWEEALQRNDHRKISLNLHIEIDGRKRNFLKSSLPLSLKSNLTMNQRSSFLNLVGTTFQSNFWLKNYCQVEYFSSNDFQFSLYTVPVTKNLFKSSNSTINGQLSSQIKKNFSKVKTLRINSWDSMSRLSFNSIPMERIQSNDLFIVYPNLINLVLTEQLLLPSMTICSHSLRSLSIRHESVSHLREFLQIFPRLTTISLLITASNLRNFADQHVDERFTTVTRLNLVCTITDLSYLTQFIQIFPNLMEFYFSMTDYYAEQSNTFDPFRTFDKIVQLFHQIRYVETKFNANNRRELIESWHYRTLSTKGQRIGRFDGKTLQIQQWL